MTLHRLLIGAALAAATLAAHAADPGPAVRPLVGFGLTFGGDTLATVQFDDGTTDSIKAGGLAHLYAGAEFRVGTAMAIQAKTSTTRAAPATAACASRAIRST